MQSIDRQRSVTDRTRDLADLPSFGIENLETPVPQGSDVHEEIPDRLSTFDARTTATRTQGAQRASQLLASTEPPGLERYRQVVESLESGGRNVYSTMQTTAGFPASFGKGQLLIDVHLGRMARLSDAELSTAGLSRDAVRAAQDRSRAMLGFYDVLVDGTQKARCPLSASEQREARDLARTGDAAALIERFGESFERTTGLPREEMASLIQTRELREDVPSSLRTAARSPNDETRSAALDRWCGEDATRLSLREQLGDSSLAFYISRGRTRENAGGWSTRAAFEGRSGAAIQRGVETLSDLTTDRRLRDNYRTAERVVQSAVSRGAVSESEASELTIRIARRFHGRPAAARTAFFEQGSPRPLNAGQLEEAILNCSRDVDGATRSDDAVKRALARLSAR